MSGHLPAWWLAAAAGVAFPGRARVVGALAGASEHADALPADALLLAAGAALAEAPRGGLVLTAVQEPDDAWWEAAARAGRLAPTALVLVAPPAVDRVRLAALGWRVVAAPQPGSGPQVVAAVWPVAAGRCMRAEWPPVQLDAIPPGLLPPWPAPAAGDARGVVDGVLGWLAMREPRLHLPPAWVGLAAAQLAAEGRRCVLRLDPGQAPEAALLARVGRLQLPLKVVADAAALPVAAPAGWWLAAPRDAGECSAALAWILSDEAPWLLALPPVFPQPSAWPCQRPWQPT